MKTVIKSEQCVSLGNNQILVQVPSCVTHSSGHSASAFGIRTGEGEGVCVWSGTCLGSRLRGGRQCEDVMGLHQVDAFVLRLRIVGSFLSLAIDSLCGFG